jgi:hypothetical protein
VTLRIGNDLGFSGTQVPAQDLRGRHLVVDHGIGRIFADYLQ